MLSHHTRTKNKDIIYRSRIGFIKGYLRGDGYWWISEFLLYPEFRGKGLARKLAKHLPEKCKLLCCPLICEDDKRYLPKHILKNFYHSLGFRSHYDEYDNLIMVRK